MLDIGIICMFCNPPFNRSSWNDIYQQELDHAVTLRGIRLRPCMAY